MGRDYFAETDRQMEEELKRVSRSIGRSVLDFLKMRMEQTHTFHAADLHDYVGSDVAPASADRVLRSLRSSGRCKYTVVSRADSLYEVTEVCD